MQKHSTLFFSGDLFKEVLSHKIYVEDPISQSDKKSPIVKFPWDKVWFGEDKEKHERSNKEKECPAVKSPWDKDKDRC